MFRQSIVQSLFCLQRNQNQIDLFGDETKGNINTRDVKRFVTYLNVVEDVLYDFNTLYSTTKIERSLY